MTDGGAISSHYVSKANSFDGHLHGVEPGQLLASKPVIHKGLHQELVTNTEECYVWVIFMNHDWMLIYKLPEIFYQQSVAYEAKGLYGIEPSSNGIFSSSLKHSAVSLSSWSVCEFLTDSWRRVVTWLISWVKYGYWSWYYWNT